MSTAVYDDFTKNSQSLDCFLKKQELRDALYTIFQDIIPCKLMFFFFILMQDYLGRIFFFFQILVFILWVQVQMALVQTKVTLICV